MNFAGVSYLAILTAAVVGWLAGAVWYMSLSKPWIAAVGLTPQTMAENRKKPGAILPFIYSFVALLVMAWVLAGIIGHLGTGQVRFENGVISGALCWLGFVITTMLVNNSFAMRNPRLLVIDGGHWLVVLLLMGAIIGAWGV
jgi:Protein of unknown function (DUF1761)